MNSVLYRGNLPTDIDIKKIRDAHPDSSLSEGDIVEYAELERLINVSKNTNRFKTVVSRWKKSLESSVGIVMSCVRNVGYQVQNDSGKLEMASDKQDSANRAIKRSVSLLSLIDTTRLEERNKKQYDALRNANAKILLNLAWKRQEALPNLTGSK